MGKVSFAVYLIHPLFLRTILVWMLYGLVSLPPDYDEDGKPIAPGILIPSGGPFRNFASILTFYLVSYTASTYWTLHVESWCAQVLAKLEAVMLAKENFQTNETELLPK